MQDDINYELIKSAADGDLDAVKRLITNGADVHAQREAALKYSRMSGNSHVTEYLISVGANEDIIGYDSFLKVHGLKPNSTDHLRGIITE